MASIYKRYSQSKDEKNQGAWTYWGRCTRAGVERRKSLKTTDRVLAKKRLSDWVAKVEAIGFGERDAHTFDDMAVKFIDEHVPSLKESSGRRYGVSIDNLARVLEGYPLASVGKAAMTKFVTMRREEGAANPTIRRDLNCLSSMMEMAIDWEWIDVNPVGPFLKRMRRRGMKESPPRTRYLNHDEEARLLGQASDYVADAIRFAIDTGLRKEEQFSRTWDDVTVTGTKTPEKDNRKGVVRVAGFDAKNAKDRSVPLWPRAMDVIEGLTKSNQVPQLFWHYDDKHTLTARRFNTMDRGLKAAAKRAGIKDLRWHDLRRTCGCRLLQDEGFSMDKVSKWLGHSSVKVTERIYAFLEVEQLHRAVAESQSRRPSVGTLLSE